MTEPVHPPWWKEPMIWLVAGLPAVAVVASFVTYFIAADNPDPLVNAGYHKEGFAPIKDSAKEERAAALLVQADLVMSEGEARIKLAGRLDRLPTSLELLLLHPTDSGQDIRILLDSRSPGIYSALAPEGTAGKRQWILEPDDHGWRLSGELTLPLVVAIKLGTESLLNPP